MNQDQSHLAPPLKIKIKAEREVAYASPDHLLPWGTRKDNSQNRRFNTNSVGFILDSKRYSRFWTWVVLAAVL